MSDVYKKVGRGGAGNYYSKQDIIDATKNSDLESQATSSTHNPTTQHTSSLPPPEYQHTGRGGAGNWVQPSELKSHGLAQESNSNPTDLTRPAEAPAKRIMGSSKPTYRGGRGGAGNYFDADEEQKRLKEEEERVRKEVEGRVERDVEAGLARPERAYGGNGGAWEMGMMK